MLIGIISIVFQKFEVLKMHIKLNGTKITILHMEFLLFPKPFTNNNNNNNMLQSFENKSHFIHT